MSEMKVLSLGAGVQSSTLLLMACHGDLPKPDAVVFADTMWEPSEVYRWLKDVLTPAASTAGIPIHTVSGGDLRADALRSTVRAHVDEDTRSASLPLHVTQPGGEGGGMLRRQCTMEYKIAPIRRKCRELLGVGPRGRVRPDAVEMWIGISADEAARMKPSGVQWIDNVYPLIDHSPPMRRSDCHAWLRRHGYEDAPRSACNGCPFRSAADWRTLKRDEEDWSDAVEFDEAIRHRDTRGGEAFIHRALVPLGEAVHDDPTERLWDDECTGMCGV